MEATCAHLQTVSPVRPESWGCEDCLASGRRDWVHLRYCLTCGHVGCCDSSPGRHASGHFAATAHPLVRSYEPGETWVWCFVDQVVVEIDDAVPKFSHP